jgi:uncharacterized phage protein (TIGR01671 family)
MREIKFRAWVESILSSETGLYYPSVLTLYKGDVTMVADKVFAEKGDDRFKFKDDTCEFTLMQYTGLKDKNGVEIYEGDVVKQYADGRLRAVKRTTVYWNEDLAAFNVTAKTQLEVIGNIYENAELLKS